MKNVLAQIPEVSFRQIPDPSGDSCTFLCWFLPTAEITHAFVDEMKSQNVFAGNFHYINNNWHYIRNWHHLKNGVSLYPLSDVQKNALDKLKTQTFPVSDDLMSRCICTAINLSWTYDQLKEKGEKMVNAIKKVLKQHTVNA